MAPNGKGSRRVHGVGWTPEQWRRLMAAAKLLARQNGTPIRVADVIRPAALQRAEEILATKDQAVPV